MLSYNVIHDYFDAFYNSVTYIKAGQSDAPTPELGYAVWNEISSVRVGREIRKFGNNASSNYVENIDVPKLETIQLIFCSKTEDQAVNEGLNGYKPAFVLADEFLTATHSEAAKNYGKTNKMSIVDYRDLSSNTRYLSDIHEIRCPVEIIINYVSNYENSIESISSASVGTTLIGI